MADVASYKYPDQEILENPYPFYAAMREQAPVYHNSATGIYFVSRYDDAVYIMRHPELFSSKRELIPIADPEIAAVRAKGLPDSVSLTTNDPPEHQRFRMLAMKIFTPKSFAALEPAVVALANRLVDSFIGRGEADLFKEYALPLPLTVICDLLALPHADLAMLKGWSDDYTLTMGAQACPLTRAKMIECAQSLTDLQLYFDRVLKERRVKPGDDLVSQMLAANDKAAEPLNQVELVDMLRIILIGGNETTTMAIANTMYYLLSKQENWARVIADPALQAKAIEESLRCQSPTQFVVRKVTADTELGGVALRAGDRVCVLWGSANRDAAKFGADSEEFKLDRTDSASHIAFGNGVHFCIGSALARIELRVTLETFAARLKNLRLKGAPRFNSHPVMRGATDIHVAFDPA